MLFAVYWFVGVLSVVMAIYYSFVYYKENTSYTNVHIAIRSVVNTIVFFGVILFLFVDRENARLDKELALYDLADSTHTPITAITNIPVNNLSRDSYTKYKVVKKVYTFKGVYIVYHDIDLITKVFFLKSKLKEDMVIKDYFSNSSTPSVPLFENSQYIDIATIDGKVFLNNNYNLNYFKKEVSDKILYSLYNNNIDDDTVIKNMERYSTNINTVKELVTYLKQEDKRYKSYVEDLIEKEV